MADGRLTNAYTSLYTALPQHCLCWSSVYEEQTTVQINVDSNTLQPSDGCSQFLYRIRGNRIAHLYLEVKPAFICYNLLKNSSSLIL